MSTSAFAAHNCDPLLLKLCRELFLCNWYNNCYNVEFLDFSEMWCRWESEHQTTTDLCEGSGQGEWGVG
jgi:hypothetical protein